MNVRIGLFCVAGAFLFTLPAMGAGHFGWWWLAGLVTVASLVPVVRFGPRSVWGEFGAIALALIVVGLACTLSEAWVFTPEMRPRLASMGIGGSVLYLAIAAVLTGLARVLKLRDAREMTIPRRSLGKTVGYVLLAGASYVLYYQIFGAITFRYFTHGYYPQALQEVAAMGGWFYVYQWGRGILMVLAVLPVILTLRLGRWQTAVAVGLLVWVVGGVGPLLAPNSLMVAEQRFIHIVEIMTQNVSLGMTAVWLLRPGGREAAGSR